MDALVRTPHITTNLTPKLIRLVGNGGITWNQTPFLTFSKGYSSISANRLRKSVVAEAKKRKKDSVDAHNFVPEPDEATGVFPEAVLLKEKKAQEDGSFLPEFADAEEVRHYEVVYLIHEKHDEEVENVNSKVQDFIREKKGKLWRLNDWGLRRLAYKIQKAKNAHYILMNFELEAQWINDFKTMLDQDERVIRHLVIKRDEAITEDCPPPPEFHTLRAGTDDYDDEEDDVDYDDEDDWDGEGEVDSNSYSDDVVDVIVPVNSDDREDKNVGRRNLRAEKVGR
ncbi:30S ribosomal protein S6 [Vitis vinifera]|uniref:30S ribosomal protein S6 n=1 Tax=Vitis vinifera TaxID=29760 RepID=A0A438CTD8_VITVI|nr:30S ribosomal protein S6 [Vitis vinifera]